jgi:aspartyl-tRNA synthetase
MEKNRIDIKYINLENLSAESNKTISQRTREVSKAREIIQKQLPLLVERLNIEIGKIAFDKRKIGVDCKLDVSKIKLYQFRDGAYRTIRDLLRQNEFIEVTTPYIVGVSTDPPRVDKGGMMEVSWEGGMRAFLRQSNQLYKQMIVASGLPRVYEIGPFWRAEASQSYRHLQESIGLDIEMSNPADLSEIYKTAYTIILAVNKYCIATYGTKDQNLVLPEPDKVPVITYAEAVELLTSKGFYIPFGEDIGLMGEARLGQIIKKERSSDVVIINDYPDTIKKFYTKKNQHGTTETFDIILAGWELVSGAIRETNRSEIEKSMVLSGIDPKDYSFYLSIIDGAVSHGGFCLGIDRLVAKLLDMEMISEAVVFPRTYNSLIP